MSEATGTVVARYHAQCIIDEALFRKRMTDAGWVSNGDVHGNPMLWSHVDTGLMVCDAEALASFQIHYKLPSVRKDGGGHD